MLKLLTCTDAAQIPELLSRESGIKMSDTDLKVAETTAGIVGRQMEQ